MAGATVVLKQEIELTVLHQKVAWTVWAVN